MMNNFTISDNISSVPLTNSVNGFAIGKLALCALATLSGFLPQTVTSEVNNQFLFKQTPYRDASITNTPLTTIVTAANDEFSMYGNIDDLLQDSVSKLYSNMKQESVSLGRDFEEVLVDNLWDMFLE